MRDSSGKAHRGRTPRTGRVAANSDDAYGRHFDALVRAFAALVLTTNAEGLVHDDADTAEWCTYTGQSPDQARGNGWMAAIHPEDREHLRPSWREALATKAPFKARGRIRHADGTYRPFEVRGVSVASERGTNAPHTWLLAGVDVTDHAALDEERAQLLAREQAARAEASIAAGQLEGIFAAMADPVLVYSLSGERLRANPAAQTLLGQQARLDRLAARMVARIARANVQPSRRNGLLPHAEAHDLTLKGDDGHLLSFNTSVAPVLGASGEVVGVVFILRDVTERRQLEQRTHAALTALLAMSEALVAPDASSASLADASPARIAVTTAEARTNAARRLASLTRDVLGCYRVSIRAVEAGARDLQPVTVVGLTPTLERHWQQEPHMGMPASPTLDAAWQKRLQAGEVVQLNMRVPPYDTAPNPYGISTVLVVPMRIGEHLIGILSLDYGGEEHTYTEDELALAQAVAKLGALVLERARLLRERTEARANARALSEANRSMDEFMSIVSHELRTPITSIKANVQLAERRLRRMAAPDDADFTDEVGMMRDMLIRANRQTELLNRLVGDLLDASRIQANRLEMRPERTDLATIVRDAVAVQRETMPRRTISLTLPDTPTPVIADADRVGQVVANFVNNALKYSPGAQPVDVALTTAHQIARVQVRDQGQGIAAEELPHIWERFRRIPGTEVEGLGLGLYISKNLIERHGGSVGVESVPDQGSTFWFTLPLADSAAN